ncbi:Variable outer membrane protein (plasmid) [Borrelia hermsii YBT]|uniref:Variable outer membrane protein n=1 Tax=Borrelia hermsii YBT TaxID=1313295 RepID=W5T7J3_BORHE|nr:Vsp/OspC family lipoprotein [Borrelia hermsii]AHH13311.1 Variable outer membrane protein [Borrelia hermsii YBT]
MRKRISAIIMTLFMVFMSCNNGGPELKSDEVAKSDGTVLDLAKISKKIKDAVEFAASVKEIETLVKSIDELAKTIGQKLTKDTGVLAADANNNNGGLIAGVYGIVTDVGTKLDGLLKVNGISEDIKTKINDSKSKGTAFLNKVKGDDDLCKKDATDAHAKNAIDKNDNTGGKGKTELIALNTAIDELVTAANDAVESAIKELTAPAKPAVN